MTSAISRALTLVVKLIVTSTGGLQPKKNRTLPQISNLGLVSFRLFFGFFGFFFRFFFRFFFSVFPFWPIFLPKKNRKSTTKNRKKPKNPKNPGKKPKKTERDHSTKNFKFGTGFFRVFFGFFGSHPLTSILANNVVRKFLNKLVEIQND